MKKALVFTSLLILALGIFLFANASPALADDPDRSNTSRSDWVGFVSKRVTTLDQKGNGPSKKLPGGGYAYAQALLGWFPLRMDGIAETGVNNTQRMWDCMAHAAAIWKGASYQGGFPWGNHADCTGGQKATQTLRVSGWVYGETWELFTNHQLSGVGILWQTSLHIFAAP